MKVSCCSQVRIVHTPRNSHSQALRPSAPFVNYNTTTLPVNACDGCVKIFVSFFKMASGAEGRLIHLRQDRHHPLRDPKT